MSKALAGAGASGQEGTILSTVGVAKGSVQLMRSDNFKRVKTAIENKQIVHGTYGGKERIMCPHAVGYGSAGEEKALFYQFDGESSSGGLPQWRCLTLSGLKIAKIVSGDWHTGTSHTTPQTCVKRVIAEWRGAKA